MRQFGHLRARREVAREQDHPGARIVLQPVALLRGQFRCRRCRSRAWGSPSGRRVALGFAPLRVRMRGQVPDCSSASASLTSRPATSARRSFIGADAARFPRRPAGVVAEELVDSPTGARRLDIVAASSRSRRRRTASQQCAGIGDGIAIVEFAARVCPSVARLDVEEGLRRRRCARAPTRVVAPAVTGGAGH